MVVEAGGERGADGGVAVLAGAQGGRVAEGHRDPHIRRVEMSVHFLEGWALEPQRNLREDYAKFYNHGKGPY